MAHVTGPISSLPGSHHKPPRGTMCDTHPERLATVRVQGETDSFGSEMIDMCDECVVRDTLEREEDTNPGTCSWCASRVDKRSRTRDYDEGSSGPIYDVCDPCIAKRNERVVEELEEHRQESNDDAFPEDDPYWEHDEHNP